MADMKNNFPSYMIKYLEDARIGKTHKTDPPSPGIFCASTPALLVAAFYLSRQSGLCLILAHVSLVALSFDSSLFVLVDCNEDKKGRSVSPP